MNSIEILRTLVRAPGPPGQEQAVRDVLASLVAELGLSSTTDAKGNLHVSLGDAEKPRIVVTAHMDEIAMIVRSVGYDGNLGIGPLGGVYAWKLGEGPVQVLCQEPVTGIMSFASIHTEAFDESGSVEWDAVEIATGLTYDQLVDRGVRPGTRVVVHPDRRGLYEVGDLIASYFLDDRADLVSWLLALEQLKDSGIEAHFIATAAEEVGGEGALYALRQLQPEVCIALELGPDVPDAPVEIDDRPTVWVNDSYSAMQASDLELLAGLGLDLQYQALSRGGSDASCAASHGLCARPFTLGLPMMNSHGFEVMHPGAMNRLAELTVKLVKAL